MTVLYCLSHINRSLQWQWFAEEMRNRGIKQVYVLIGTDNENEIFFYKDLLKLGVDVYILPHTGKLPYSKNIQHMRAIIKKHKPDIVHTSLPLGGCFIPY